MKKNEVKVGTVYRVKVSGSVQDVRITGENPHGGWDGVNVATNRKVRVKSPQRLRSVAAERPAKRRKIVSLAEYESEAAAPAEAAPAPDGATGTVASDLPGPTGGAEAGADGKKRRAASNKPDKERKPSGLDAAAMVLAEAGEPLNTKDMVERMLAKGLWRTGGKTPAATIYAAILREITVKGDASRFRKTERGKFTVALPGDQQ